MILRLCDASTLALHVAFSAPSLRGIGGSTTRTVPGQPHRPIQATLSVRELSTMTLGMSLEHWESMGSHKFVPRLTSCESASASSTAPPHLVAPHHKMRYLHAYTAVPIKPTLSTGSPYDVCIPFPTIGRRNNISAHASTFTER